MSVHRSRSKSPKKEKDCKQYKKKDCKQENDCKQIKKENRKRDFSPVKSITMDIDSYLADVKEKKTDNYASIKKAYSATEDMVLVIVHEPSHNGMWPDVLSQLAVKTLKNVFKVKTGNNIMPFFSLAPLIYPSSLLYRVRHQRESTLRLCFRPHSRFGADQQATLARCDERLYCQERIRNGSSPVSSGLHG